MILNERVNAPDQMANDELSMTNFQGPMLMDSHRMHDSVLRGLR